ncbi:RNA polymerase sigma factor [uncultured Oscillibacter sp.]|uniref:RNA polymerase sigma factor n=1 Tax=uncultured Oscillibacter sp. TaxID=876091 RepID=UPI0025E67527|nr:sigma-70 family RNA polymerase sigma factor [uncultured Oscillibacter sp.]
MEDRDIIALYWERSEEAIRRTAEKYGAYCAGIIRRVLGDSRDAEECLSDTWLGAWNAMPPQRPRRLPPFLGRIARNRALDRYDYDRAQCRDSGFEAVLEELSDCVGGTPLEEGFDLLRLGEAISGYLDTVSPAARLVFLRRYWYCDSVAEIAAGTGYSPSKVKSQLHRTRKGLKEHLRKEGYDL